MEQVLTFIKEKVLKNTWFIALLIAPVVLLLAYGISTVKVFQNIELKLIDAKFAARGADEKLKKSSDVVIITLTDQALASVPERFPWPRSYYGKLVENLKKAGVKAVAFDIVFDDEDKAHPGSDQHFAESIVKNGNVVLAGRLSTEATDESNVSYTSQKDFNFQNIFSTVPGSRVGLVSVVQDGDGVLRRYYPTYYFQGKQVPSFAYAALETSNTDTVRNEDNGKYFSFLGKKIPTYDGQFLLLNYYGPNLTFPTISAENILDDHDFFTTQELKAFNELRAQGHDSLSLVTDKSLRSQWATDTFDDEGDPELGLPPLGLLQTGKLRGKIAIVGPAFPESKDLFPTPFSSQGGREDQNRMYGVEVHATAAQNFIRGDFISRMSDSTYLPILLLTSYLIFGVCVAGKRIKYPKNNWLVFATLLVALLAVGSVSFAILYFLTGEGDTMVILKSQSTLFNIGLFSSILLLSVGITYLMKRTNSMPEFINEIGAIVLSLLCFFIIYRYSVSLFISKRILMQIVPISATILLSYIASIFYQYFTESRQKKQIKGFFDVYVPKPLVEQLIDNPDLFRLGGERRELTMLFSDIKGFTNISESFQSDPEGLVVLMNEYLGAMTNIVLNYGGTLDKYIGDAVVAFWGAPLRVEDHAKRACWAALDMQEKLVELRKKWKLEGKPEIFTRIGVNTGVVIVGNMGSQFRFSYTAMGDAMNLAARLEAANKAFKTSIMISEFTKAIVEEYCRTRELATITVQGKEQPIKVYELVAKKKEGVKYEELPPAPTAAKGVMAIAKE
jgi:class 3 adenylate cyclase/CHASE2 domain-containing sensor protein